MNTDRDQWISCHCCHSYVCHSERSLLLCRPEDPDVPNTSSTGLQHPALNKTTYPFHQRARRIPYCYFSKFFISLFPLTKFFFSNFLSTKQAHTAQHHHSAADNKSVSRFTKKKGANHLHWFGSYTMIPNVNPTAFMLNFLLCVLQLTLCSKTMLKSSFQRLGVFMFPIQWLMQWAISEMNLTLSTSNVWIGEQKQSACSKVTTMAKILSKTIILSVSYLWTSYSQN